MKRWTHLGAAALALAFLMPGPVAEAAPFAKDPIDAVKDEVEKKKSEKEKETEERLKQFEDDQAKNKARVVVIQWQNTDVTYQNELLQRNIKARTTRSNALFVPDVDLYQQGRRELDTTLRPLDQRASVPDSTIDIVNAAVDATAAIPWDGLPEQDWGQKAAELKSLSEEIWFVDREELREPLFRLYSQIGRAAENANNSTPPYYEEVGGVAVNYYYYLAAALAQQTPDLMSKLHNSDLINAIGNYKEQLETGRFATLSLNFELNGDFKAREFTGEYKVFIDGVETQITNEEALHEVPAGRSDVYLERGDDGHGLSVRVEEVRVDAEEIYSVREQARKRMGLDFQKQLMKNKNQCLPEVDDDVLTYVAIYQKLHPGQEIYIAVPEGGSVNRIHLWKWVEERGQLVKIADSANSFPVRFVGLIGTGLQFGGASFADPFETEPFEAAGPDDLQPPAGLADFQDRFNSASQFIDLRANGLPIAYEIRGHWDRLFVGLGLDFTANLQGDGWVEIPVTGTKNHRVTRNGLNTLEVSDENNRILLQQSEVRAVTQAGTFATHPVTMGNLGDTGYKARRFSRNMHMTVGGVLGRDAAAGFGLRGGVRAGLLNAPHAVDLTGRVGYALAVKPKKKRKADSRVQALVDTELFGGALLPYGDTIHLLTNQDVGNTAFGVTNDDGSVWGRQLAGKGETIAITTDADNPPKLKKIGKPIATFGIVLKAGLTF